MKQFYLSLALLVLTTLSLTAQVRLNEAVSSNATYFDEDGDSPDWFELHNAGSTAIDLTGFTLSDKADNPGKWTIGPLSLEADGYALLWASGKDRPSVSGYRTYVDRGNIFRYLLPTGPVPTNWTSTSFDDSAWQSGPTGIGYGDGDDATIVPAGTPSIFLRRSFEVASVEGLEELVLDIDYDDGFVAYLNGNEIARANINGTPPAWDARTNDFTEPRIVFEGPPERFTGTNAAGLLVAGTNVLSIQVHNFNATSSDLTIIPFLSAKFSGFPSDGIVPPALLNLPRTAMHTNFKLSADGETLFMHAPDGTFVDSLPVIGLPADVSVGIPGNGGPARIFANTTPGARNPDDGFLGIIPDELVFSVPGGFVDPLDLTLSGVTVPGEIRYTLDATEPTSLSQSYSAPLTISQTTVVRAAIFREGFLPSPIRTETYFIGTTHNLPVVNLVTEPDNLFDPITGIYERGENYQDFFPFFGSNFWEDIEHPVHFSFFDTNGESYASNAGIKIFGGYSRALAQRSFSLFARGRYGNQDFDQAFFPLREYDEFQALVLRNSGNDWESTMLRDVVLTGLMENSNLDVQAYRTVASYINGNYWGIYNLREKINEHYLASLHNVEPDEVDIVERDAQVIHGSNEEYLELHNFLESNNLLVQANYDWVTERIDLPNYLQYQAVQIYYDNRDWPGNNIKYWKAAGGKWRWILFDTDFGGGIWSANNSGFNTLDFALEANGPNWPNPPWSTLLFRRLMANTDFRNNFINQLADEMNTRFLSQNVISRIDERANVIRSEMDRHRARWGTLEGWNDNVNSMREFFSRRPARMKEFVKQQYNLPAHHRLNVQVSDSDHGYLLVNSLTIEVRNWSGDYFQNVPIKVTAVPREGYEFSHWELSSNSENPELTINMTGQQSYRAIFVEETNSVPVPGSDLRLVAGVDVSPNPSGGELRLSFNVRRLAGLTAKLFDANGRELRTLFSKVFGAGTRVHTEDVSSASPGVYWVELREDGGGRAVVKWVRR